MVKEIVFNYLSMKTLKMKKKIYVIYIYIYIRIIF